MQKYKTLNVYRHFIQIKIEKFLEIFKCTLIYYIKLIRTNNLTAQKHVCIYENYNNKL